MAKKWSGESTRTNDKESYVVGQVAASLSCNETAKGKTTPLMNLFSTPSISTGQFLIPILEHKVSGKKRKIPEDMPAIGNKAKQQKLEKKKLVRRKELATAEQKLSLWESALNAAGEEDEGVQCTKRKRRREPTEGGSLTAMEKPMAKAAKRFRKRMANPGMEKIKSERTLFVGNLPTEYSKQMIIALFKEFGPIETVRLRSVAREEPSISRKLATIQRKVHPKRNNMNAYVVFRRCSDAVRALTRNGYKVQTGFNIRVDLATMSNVHDHRRSIFLGNLSYDIQENDVRDHFCECGEVESIRIVRDRESGMGKGFGYMLLQSTDAVMLALELNNSELKGRKVRVSRSVKKERDSRDPAANRQAEEKKLVAKDFTGLMVKSAEGKKTKIKNQGKKNKRNVSKSKKK